MTTEKLINDSVADVKEVFEKLDIDTTSLDFTGKNEAMFNSVFIKSFLNRLNAGDYEHFKELREDFLQPVPTFSFGSLNDENPYADIKHSSDTEE